MLYRVWQCSEPAGPVTSECDRVLFIRAGQWTKCGWPSFLSEIWMSRSGLGTTPPDDACHGPLYLLQPFWLPCTTGCSGVRLAFKEAIKSAQASVFRCACHQCVFQGSVKKPTTLSKTRNPNHKSISGKKKKPTQVTNSGNSSFSFICTMIT